MAPLDNTGNFVRQALTASVGTNGPETMTNYYQRITEAH